MRPKARPRRYSEKIKFECFVCSIPCETPSQDTCSQLAKWQQDWSSGTDDSMFLTTLNLDCIEKDQCLCGTCSKLLVELEKYEALASKFRSELLDRLECRKQGKIPAPSTLITDNVLEPIQLAAHPEPDGAQRRSSRRSLQKTEVSRTSVPSTGGRRSLRQTRASPSTGPSSGARRRSGRLDPLSVVEVDMEVSRQETPPSGGTGRAPDLKPRSGARRGTEVRRGRKAVGDGDGVPGEVGAEDDVSDGADGALSDAGDVAEGDAASDGESDAAEEREAHDPDPDWSGSEDDSGSERGDRRDARDADYDPTPAKTAAEARRSAESDCVQCGLQFGSAKELQQHRRREHRNRGGPSKCSQCQKTFKNFNSLVTHRRLAHGPGQKCKQCDEVFRDMLLYYRHLADAHGDAKFTCEHCGAAFARNGMLKKHLVKEERKIRRAKRIERLKTLQCSVCDFRPELKCSKRAHGERRVRNWIRDHEYKAHGMHGAITGEALAIAAAGAGGGAPPPEPAAAAAAEDAVVPAPPSEEHYSCDTCGLVFGCRRALLQHKVNKHKKKPTEPVPVVQCEMCGKEFRGSGNLRIHQEATHGTGDSSRMLTCEYCGKQYHRVKKKHYLSHIQQKHLMNEFICPEAGCGKKFLQQRGLERHIKSIHETAHACGVCAATFPSVWKRDKHRAEAHGQYDFECSYCALKFFRRSEMEIHERRQHTLQLRYQCSVCETRSEERRKLLNHEYTSHGLHTLPLPENNPAGQLSYPCPGCGVRYACGLAAKQHAWDAHQIKLDIYGKPKNRSTKPAVSNVTSASVSASRLAHNADINMDLL